MAGSGFRMVGGGEMPQRLTDFATQFPQRVAGAVYRRAEQVMTRSKEQFVPVDLGTLKNSGTVWPPEIKGTTIVVTLSYGGAAKAYALAVHEHLSAHSPPSWRNTKVTFQPSGRGPKYLERPLMEAVNTLPADLASDLQLGGG